MLDDLSQVVEIYNRYVATSHATFEVSPVRPDDRVGWFQEHSGAGRYRLLVATEGANRVVGWATSSRFRPRAAYDTSVEASVYCRDGWSGRGIGRRLYATLFRAIAEEDIERILAGISLPNAASVALHRSFGFRRVGIFHRVGRKFDRYWDVAWYERPLRLRGPGRDHEEQSLSRTDAPAGPSSGP